MLKTPLPSQSDEYSLHENSSVKHSQGFQSYKVVVVLTVWLDILFTGFLSTLILHIAYSW